MNAILQAVIVIFVLFALSRAYLRVRDKQISLIQFFFWCSIWGAVLVLLFVPWILNTLAVAVGIGRGVDIAIYLSIILLF